MNFEVSFSKSQQELAELLMLIEKAGEGLEELERTGLKTNSRYQKSLEKTARRLNKMEGDVGKLTGEQEAFGRAVKKVAEQYEKFLTDVASGNTKAKTEIAALKNSTDELGKALRDKLANETYSKWLKKTASESANLRGENEHLRASIDHLDNPQRRLNLRLQATKDHMDRLTTAGHKQSLQSKELQQQLKIQGSSLGALNDVYRERIRGVKQGNTADERQRNQISELVREYQSLYGGLGEQVATQKALNQARSQELTADIKLIAEVEKLERKVRDYSTSLHANKAALEETLRQKRALATQEQREISNLQNLRNQLKGMDSARGKETATLKEAIKAKQRELSLTSRELTQKAELERELRSLTDGEARQIAVLKERTREQRRAVSADARRESQTRELRRELEFLHSAEGRAQMALRQRVAAERDAIRARNDSNRASRTGSQLTASMRAGLAGLSASFGMYTSSTIAAASVTYAFAAALRDTLSAGMEFTESMSRAEAVMYSTSDAISSSSEQMKSLESQVRALGQSTVFTATEVSGGLIDLAMAGLSGGEALTALKPSLDLASIGMIEMSESADIATNVMTAFKKDASDLPDVVNVMATAVTNSNTNIQQLANSLSYVGPAAQSAGFSMRDTVSAIELLSSSGIKGSKAGTGLRRTMLNLLNPTTKGTKVLEDYNISVLETDGSTRSLIDIMGQFKTALYNDAITPAERTAAIVDLVGVRAQSAFARMASSSDDLIVLREQLDNVAGAAERMREKIEDNLTADWKQVKSAFQEIELSIFEDFESQLRNVSAATTTWLHSLNEAADVIGKFDQVAGFETMGPEGEIVDVTQLDVLIARLEMAGQAAAIFLGAWAGSKVLGVMSKNLSHLSTDLRSLSDRAKASANSQRIYTAALQNSNGAMAASTLQMRAMTLASTGTAYAVNFATVAVHRLATAGVYLSKAFGWVGLIWGAYTALNMAFGSSVADKITDQKDRIQEAENAYKGYKEEIEATQNLLNREALGERQKTLANNIKASNEMLEEQRRLLTRLSEANNEAGQSSEYYSERMEAVKTRIAMLANQAGDASEELDAVKVSLDKLGSAPKDISTLEERMDAFARSSNYVADESEKVEQILEQLNGAYQTSPHLIARMGEKSEMLTAVQHALTFALGGTNDELERLGRLSIGAVAQIDQIISSLDSEFRREQSFEALTNAEKQLVLEQKIREARADSIRIDAELMLGDIDIEQASRQYAKIEELVEGYKEEVYETVKTEADAEDDRKSAHDAWVARSRSEQEQVSHLKTRQEELTASIQRQEELKSQDSSLYDTQKHAELLKERNQVAGQYDSLLQQTNKSQHQYSSELEKQKKALEKIDASYKSFESHVQSEAQLLSSSKARNNLLYQENLSLAERSELMEQAYNLQAGFLGTLDSIRDRSDQIAEVESRVVELRERALTLSGKPRKEAEDAVAKALDRQADLVKKQLDDYQKLVDASNERTREVTDKNDEVREQEKITSLINQSAEAGRLLNEQDAQSIIQLERKRQDQTLLNAKIKEQREQLKGLTGEEKSRHQVVLQAMERERNANQTRISQIQTERTEISQQVETLKAQADAIESFYDETGDAVYETLRSGFDDVDGMFKSIEESFKDLLAKMVYEALINPIIVQMKQSAMQGFGGGGGSIPGLGGGGGMPGLGGITDSLGGGISNLFGGGGSAAGGLYANAATGSAAGAGLYGTAATGAVQGGLYGTAATGGVAAGGGGMMAGMGSMAAAAGPAIAAYAAMEAASWLDKKFSSDAKYGIDAGGIGVGFNMISKGIFGGDWETKDAGIALGSNDGSLSANQYERERKSGGLFSGSSYRINESALESDVEDSLHAMFDSQKTALEKSVEMLGIQKDSLGGFKAEIERIDTRGMDESEVQGAISGWMAGVMDDAAIDAVQQLDSRMLDIVSEAEGVDITGFDEFEANMAAKAEKMGSSIFASLAKSIYEGAATGEGAADALNIAGKIEGLSKITDELGGAATENVFQHLERMVKTGEQSVRSTIDGLSTAVSATIQLADASERLGLKFDATAEGAIHNAFALQDYAGGIENLSNLQSSFYQNFFSETERTEHQLNSLTEAFDSLGFTIPESKEQYRELVLAQDLNTEAGRENQVQLMQLNQAFSNLAPKIEGTAEAAIDYSAAISERNSLDKALLKLQGDSQALQKLEIEALKDIEGWKEKGLVSTQKEIWALEEKAKAEEKTSRAAAEYRRELEQVRSQLGSFAVNVNDWINGIRSGDSGLGSPGDQLAASSQAFDEQYQKALTGDRDALGSITQYADRFIAAQKNWSASGDQTVGTIDRVTGLLENLPDKLSAEQFLADSFDKSISENLPDAIVEAVTATEYEIQSLLSFASNDDNVPEVYRSLLRGTLGNLEASVDYLMGNNELSPDLIELATGPLGRMTSTVDYLLGDNQLSDSLINIALGPLENMSSTMDYLLGTNELSESLINIAVGAVDDISQTVDFVLGSELSEDNMNLALGGIEGYTANIDFAVQSNTIPEYLKKLIVQSGSYYSAYVDTLLGSDNLTSEDKRLALDSGNVYGSTIDYLLGSDNVSDDLKELALEEGNNYLTSYSVLLGSDNLNPGQKRLALNTGNNYRTTVDNVLRTDSVTEDVKSLALGSSNTYSSYVDTLSGLNNLSENDLTLALQSGQNYQAAVDYLVQSDTLTDDEKRLSLTSGNDYRVALTNLLEEDNLTQENRRLALESGNSYGTLVGLTAEDNITAWQRRLSLQVGNDYETTVELLSDDSLTSDERRMALTAGNDYTSTVTTLLDRVNSQEDALNLSVDSTANRIKSWIEARQSGLSEDAALELALDGADRNIDSYVRGIVADNTVAQATDLLDEDNRGIDSYVRGITSTLTDSDALALTTKVSNRIKSWVNAQKSGLSEQDALDLALNGADREIDSYVRGLVADTTVEQASEFLDEDNRRINSYVKGVNSSLTDHNALLMATESSNSMESVINGVLGTFVGSGRGSFTDTDVRSLALGQSADVARALKASLSDGELSDVERNLLSTEVGDLVRTLKTDGLLDLSDDEWAVIDAASGTKQLDLLADVAFKTTDLNELGRIATNTEKMAQLQYYTTRQETAKWIKGEMRENISKILNAKGNLSSNQVDSHDQFLANNRAQGSGLMDQEDYERIISNINSNSNLSTDSKVYIINQAALQLRQGRLAQWERIIANHQYSPDNFDFMDGSHATGLEYVPFDGYRAELHKGEMVVPSEDANYLRETKTQTAVGPTSHNLDVQGDVASILRDVRNELRASRKQEKELLSRIADLEQSHLDVSREGHTRNEKQLKTSADHLKSMDRRTRLEEQR